MAHSLRHAGRYATMVSMDYNTTELKELGERHQRLRDELADLRPKLAQEIRLATAAGVTQVEIVRATGYTRDQIRQICLPADRKRSRKNAA